MTNDVTGFGAIVTLVASNTYPVGIPITEFADDADPFDSASIAIADTAMGLNGDLISWGRATPLPAVLNVIPGSDDDVALGILAEANRVGQGKVSARDIITLTIAFPDGSITTYIQGKLTNAMFSKSIAGSGRLKTKPYVFAFQNKIGA